MSFTLRPYKDIMLGTRRPDETRNEDGFEDTRASLRGKYAVESVNELPLNRRHQVQFIEKASEILHFANKNDITKAGVITGLMLLERAAIAIVNGENIFDITEQDLRATSASQKSRSHRSLYFRCLGKNLGITRENFMELEDYQEYLFKARQFLRGQVYNDGNSSRGFNRNHPFAKIEGLDIQAYLKLCANLIAETDNRIVDRNAALQAEELRKETADELQQKEGELQRTVEELRKKSASNNSNNSSWLGGLTNFSIWSSAPPASPVHAPVSPVHGPATSGPSAPPTTTSQQESGGESKQAAKPPVPDQDSTASTPIP
jgi:hypothetical protein